MTINATAASCSLYVPVGEEQGVGSQICAARPRTLLKECVAAGTSSTRPGAMRLAADVRLVPPERAEVEPDLDLRLPPAREGRLGDPELGFTFANAIAYVHAAIKRVLTWMSSGPAARLFLRRA